MSSKDIQEIIVHVRFCKDFLLIFWLKKAFSVSTNNNGVIFKILNTVK